MQSARQPSNVKFKVTFNRNENRNVFCRYNEIQKIAALFSRVREIDDYEDRISVKCKKHSNIFRIKIDVFFLCAITQRLSKILTQCWYFNGNDMV